MIDALAACRRDEQRHPDLDHDHEAHDNDGDHEQWTPQATRDLLANHDFSVA